MSGCTILMAGGGSGGHISPGLAVAEGLERTDSRVRCLFAHSGRSIDAEMLGTANRTGVPLPAVPPSLRPLRAVAFARAFAGSRRRSEQLIREADVAAVVLLGGFVAAPVAAAARRLGIPRLLVNLDRVPGRANRWMRRRATRVCSAVTTTLPFADDIVGMPIRAAAAPPGDAASCRRSLGLDPDMPTLLITGASQGAGTINRLMPEVARRHPELMRGWQVVHLSGRGSQEAASQAWRDAGVDATVYAFRHDMGVLWGAADLAISRAGACSVAEITHAGVPAIYLPYPHHKDDHQRHNCMPAVEAGAACSVADDTDTRCTMERLVEAAGPLLARETPLHAMRAAAAASAGRNAADVIARMALDLAGRR
ncbi:MAG: UDP-N-acetylglucosamine--N-acetylmuramyl-(pentapeptide) pyrophosphoryl-undecaprenol N-acetylglucosamine transferase [Phycisphaerales bacterium]|nr:UDP-N-acetylglucosamine--N-acetylmuramyl-(pentapeptide) pyrophosphoryl-undecaprenol N-acetylglucosamine transferase [Phycisphaerales bacterium]